MIIGTIDLLGPLKTGFSEQTRYGRFLISDRLVHYHLLHGSCEEYHFFYDDVRAGHATRERLAQTLDQASKIKIFSVKKLGRMLRDLDYTALHTNFPAFLEGISSIRATTGKAIPITVVPHSLSYRFLVKEFTLYLLSQQGTPFDSIIAPSLSGAETLRRIFEYIGHNIERQTGVFPEYKVRFDHIPFGVDTAIYRPRDKQLVRRQLRFPEDTTLILCLGRLSVYDKMDLYPLLRAFKRVATQTSQDLALVIAGDDSRHDYSRVLLRSARQLGISRQVIILRNIDEAIKPLLYSACDIFVSPVDSVQETFGVTILEAMASGLPVIGSDWDGYKELIKHSETGFRIPTYWSDVDAALWDVTPLCIAPYRYIQHFWMGEHLYLGQALAVDVETMAEQMLYLMEDRGLREAMGSKGRQLAEDKYDWSKIVPAYEQLWDKLKSEAQSASIKSQATSVPFYSEVFRHYPTKFINNDTVLRATPDADVEMVLPVIDTLYYYRTDLDAIVRVLRHILQLAQSGAAIRVILQSVESTFPEMAIDFKYLILWMLKHDLLTRAQESQIS